MQCVLLVLNFDVWKSFNDDDGSANWLVEKLFSLFTSKITQCVLGFWTLMYENPSTTMTAAQRGWDERQTRSKCIFKFELFVYEYFWKIFNFLCSLFTSKITQCVLGFWTLMYENPSTTMTAAQRGWDERQTRSKCIFKFELFVYEYFWKIFNFLWQSMKHEFFLSFF